MIQSTIKVTHKSTSNAFIAKQWLDSLPDLFAADFETAVRYRPEEQTAYLEQSKDLTLPIQQRAELISKGEATALDHPSHCTITHFSAAWSDHEGFVIVMDNDAVARVVLRFLVTTKKTQIWHNLSYDAKHIMYHTGQFPLVYEDTQILSKTLLNHVDVHKASTGLKELAGHKYGEWAVSSDYFTLDNIHNPKLIKYAAIDACATYWLWNEIQSQIEG
jgi:DNA polymerase I-like protein with 3'-5' exonuclease and polymerase domains